MIDAKNIPSSVAIIMDGNGRWAKNKRMPRVVGHNAGMKAMRDIVRAASDMGIKYLTVYAFSTENWNRSDEEINGIFKLLIKYVDSDINQLSRNNVKINILGDRSKLPKIVDEKIQFALDKTAENTGLCFNIAINYGSRSEIVYAVKKIANDMALGKITDGDIDESMISRNLYTGELDIPDPDLVIRTSGEIRLSNFLMWQLAYSEMVFMDCLWPDFTEEHLREAVFEYQRRNRRFGGR